MGEIHHIYALRLVRRQQHAEWRRIDTHFPETCGPRRSEEDMFREEEMMVNSIARQYLLMIDKRRICVSLCVGLCMFAFIHVGPI